MAACAWGATVTPGAISSVLATDAGEGSQTAADFEGGVLQGVFQHAPAHDAQPDDGDFVCHVCLLKSNQLNHFQTCSTILVTQT
jgi:hypothetical protein